MKRDDFTCLSCGSKDKTLNVHHKTYRKGADPWDYDDDNFATYCENCHKEIHGYIDDIKMRLNRDFKAMVFSFLVDVDDDRYLEMMNVIRLIATGSIDDPKDQSYERRVQMVEELNQFLTDELVKMKAKLKK